MFVNVYFILTYLITELCIQRLKTIKEITLETECVQKLLFAQNIAINTFQSVRSSPGTEQHQ